jgi:diguanylate cyclase (GGDEF)-like protein
MNSPETLERSMSSQGEPVGATGSSPKPAYPRDDVELARLTRALKTLSAGNHTLLHAAEERQLLQDMCSVIVDKGGYVIATVAYPRHDPEKSLLWMASAGPLPAFDSMAQYSWADNEHGQTATATAIRTGAAVIGRNILVDPAYDGPIYAALRAHAIGHGYASVTAFPLRLNNGMLGALSIASAEADAFDDAEVTLLRELADDLAFGIGMLRARERHRAAEETIAHLAYFDTLTGLPNRTRLLDDIESAIAAAHSKHRTLALLHVEVGRISEINQVLGYRSGDALLVELGQRLAQLVDEGCTLARVGEAEFAILLPSAGADDAVLVSRRLLGALRRPVEVSGLTLDTRARIGIALYPGHAIDADTLVRRANAALHQALPARGGYAIYAGEREKANNRRLSLMSDLHRAISGDELRLYCQPKVDFVTGEVCGGEALVRWPHPRNGMISPLEFIPLAEQAGVITPLTHWMLDAAFRQSHAWQQAGLYSPLAVNLSAMDLYDPDLADRIRGLFATWGIAPEMMQFELTESALMLDPDEAFATLTRLKRLGVQLFIDDFGTGHSSLSYLQKLPVDAVKIDQSFVIPMVESGDSKVIVRSTIELGHNLGLKVVAEGVETEAIWASLSHLRCDVAQGYLISEPMPADQFQEWAGRWMRAHDRSAPPADHGWRYSGA